MTQPSYNNVYLFNNLEFITNCIGMGSCFMTIMIYLKCPVKAFASSFCN